VSSSFRFPWKHNFLAWNFFQTSSDLKKIALASNSHGINFEINIIQDISGTTFNDYRHETFPIFESRKILSIRNVVVVDDDDDDYNNNDDNTVIFSLH
jgi:hypothetical protein